jgi:acetylglutamate kinase
MATYVIKYGGSVSGQPTALLTDLALATQAGHRIVIVHGGGPEITSWLTKFGHSSHFVQGQRYTDAITLDIVEMVLCGRVNKWLVRAIQASGVNAVGLSGEDGGLVSAITSPADGSLGFVGHVQAIDVSVITALLTAGFVPVIAPLGLDDAGQVHNINADLVAGRIAGALQADAFILATDVAGVKKERDGDPVACLRNEQVKAWIEQEIITDGMIPKVQAAMDALAYGSSASYIVDARQHGLFEALAQKRSFGTQIIA